MGGLVVALAAVLLAGGVAKVAAPVKTWIVPSHYLSRLLGAAELCLGCRSSFLGPPSFSG